MSGASSLSRDVVLSRSGTFLTSGSIAIDSYSGGRSSSRLLCPFNRGDFGEGGTFSGGSALGETGAGAGAAAGSAGFSSVGL